MRVTARTSARWWEMSAKARGGLCRAGRIRAGRLLLPIMLALAACTSAPTAPATPVFIADFKMVSGRWVGVVSGMAGSHREGDWVEVTIGEDGTYNFGIHRTIGMFAGKGQLALKDGKLTSEGERGHATYSLYERGGKQYLRAEGVLRPNTPISGDLRRAR